MIKANSERIIRLLKKRCITFYFLCFVQLVSYSQTKCCCGTPKELSFPAFDFEISPFPAPAGFDNYKSGNSIGQSPWIVIKGSIDYCDKDCYFMSSSGNPNGPSNFIDLWGYPSVGGGGMQYPLTGLTPGTLYTIEFYYAKFDIPGNFIAYIKIANGAWLNATWTATNPGNIIWLKASYNFTAQTASAALEIGDAGSSSAYTSAVLIDDIKLFECPIDLEKPMVNNPPQDLKVGCDMDVPSLPSLDITDNCDPSPVVKVKETTQSLSSCFKTIKREWTITDACGNSTIQVQIIDVVDEPAFVNNPPEDKVVECENDVPILPTLDIIDNCVVKPKVRFKETFETIDSCTKKILREWTITDACDNVTTASQIIDIIDKNPPQFTKLPDNKQLTCDNDVLKEFNDWIKKYGNATAKDKCGVVSWRTNFNRLPKNYCDTVLVEFIARDHCGNESSKSATFIVRDTIAPKFIVKAQNKNFVCLPNTKDSLRSWLTSYGFSQATTDCDTLILSSNFNGDSTLNPLNLTFYAKDRCGHIDSCLASFAYRSNSDTFRITNYSCSFSQNTADTIAYTVNGCDSVVILRKIKQLSDSSYFQLNTCDPFQKKLDTIHLTNSVGCDSLIFYEYILQAKTITNLQKMDCAYTQVSRDTAYYLGQYCDSLVITDYLPLRKDSSFMIRNTCDISKVDTTIQPLTNAVGCDSIVTVYTLYSQQQMTFINTKVCGLSKTYTDTVKFASGFCDSLVITTYTALKLDTNYIHTTSCDKSKIGLFSNKLTNQNGCDSLVVEDVLLNPSDSIFISNSTCSFSQAGINILKFQNLFGCDSIVQTTTMFIPSDTTQIAKISCDISSAGLKTIIFKGVQCDSVVFINTTFIAPDTTQITQTSCDPSTSGLSKVILQNTQGCDSLILINTSYVPLRLEFELDSITCFNQNDGIFKIKNAGDFSKPVELFLNNAMLGNQTQISNLSQGSYEIYLRDQKGCITDSITFTLINPEALIIDLGNDLEVNKGTSINLNLQSNKSLQSIFWQPTNLTNCNNCNQINFVIDQDTWVFAQAIDERNCIQTDSIFIRIKKSGSVFAPNTFSPNGDNINDYFFIKGDDNAVVETLFIYDRWGEKVFEALNVPVNVPSVGWNGSFNSQKMNPGVYVYFAKVRMSNQDKVELKGDLNLIR